MPAMFALADQVIEQPQTAIFAAFGSFAFLVLAEFGGPPRTRLTAYLSLAGAGVVLIVVGTLCSGNAWLATGAMAVVGFAILFSGVIHGYFTAAATAGVLLFVLPGAVPAPVSAPPRPPPPPPRGAWPPRAGRLPQGSARSCCCGRRGGRLRSAATLPVPAWPSRTWLTMRSPETSRPPRPGSPPPGRRSRLSSAGSSRCRTSPPGRPGRGRRSPGSPTNCGGCWNPWWP